MFEPDGLTTIRDIQRKGHSYEIHISGITCNRAGGCFFLPGQDQNLSGHVLKSTQWFVIYLKKVADFRYPYSPDKRNMIRMLIVILI